MDTVRAIARVLIVAVTLTGVVGCGEGAKKGDTKKYREVPTKPGEPPLPPHRREPPVEKK